MCHFTSYSVVLENHSVQNSTWWSISSSQSNAACTVQVYGLRDSFLGQIIHHINSTICVFASIILALIILALQLL